MSSKSTLLIALAVGAVLAWPAAAANSLDVNANAAMNGTNFGLEVLLDGSTNNAFVQDDTPAAETTYRATFWLDPNGVTMGPFERFPIFLARDATFQNILRLQLQWNPIANKYRLRMQILKNNGDWANARANGDTGEQFVPLGLAPSGPKEVTIQAHFENNSLASVSVTANGQTFYKDSFQAGNWSVDTIRFGATRAITGSMNGSFYLDEFSSFRTLAP